MRNEKNYHIHRWVVIAIGVLCLMTPHYAIGNQDGGTSDTQVYSEEMMSNIQNMLASERAELLEMKPAEPNLDTEK